MSTADQVALWGALLKHPAWRALEELCDGHVSSVAGQVLQPARTTEDSLMHNVQRGEIMGVHYVLGLPQTMWEQAQRALAEERGVDGDEPEVEQSNVP